MSAQVVVLMAGAGTRFAREGFIGSKPLIDVGGVPMFLRAMAGLAGLDRDPITTYVVRRQQIDEESIDAVVRGHDAAARIVVLEELTSGAAASAAAAIDALDPDLPVVVLDCDLWFESAAYTDAVNAVSAGVDRSGAVLLTFTADDPRYSYVAAGADGLATAIAEKRVISSRAIAGAYCFASSRLFAGAVAQVLARGTSGSVPELYMSEVLKDVLASGQPVRVTEVDDYLSFGTPEELRASLMVLR